MKKAIFNIEKVIVNRCISWNEEADNFLLEKSKIYSQGKKKIDWKKIANFFINKTPFQCFRRYTIICPIYKKGKWTKEEDEMVSYLVDQFGKSWNFISKIIKNRTSKQIRLRYNNYLNPELKKDDFSKEEDFKIISLYKIFCNQWTKYKDFVPGRSDKIIKRRFFKLIKKNPICINN